MSYFIDRKTAEIVSILKKNKTHSLPKNQTPRKGRTVALASLILSLLGTTIPHVNLNIFFSAATIVSGLIWFHFWWRSGRRIHLAGWKTPALAAVLLSQVASCSGMLMSEQPLDPIALGIKGIKVLLSCQSQPSQGLVYL
jgi:hypothetical protein